MRTFKFTAALLAIGMLSIASLAYASAQFTQTANVTLTAVKAGKPTGLKAALLSTDPGAVQPQGLKTLTIALPSATKFNFKSSAIKQCKASDIEIKATLGSACPAKSVVGSGTVGPDPITAGSSPGNSAVPSNDRRRSRCTGAFRIR